MPSIHQFYGNRWMWEDYPNQKVVFDAREKLIYVSEGVTELNVTIDIYSAWKEWKINSPEAPHPTAYPNAFSVVGGDDITATQKLGGTFFLENGWRLKPWPSKNGYVLTIDGNLYTREAGGNPVIPESNVTISLTRSNLIDVVVVEPVAATISPADVATIADAVWNESLSDHTNPGTTGKKLSDNLKKTQYIARI